MAFRVHFNYNAADDDLQLIFPLRCKAGIPAVNAHGFQNGAQPERIEQPGPIWIRTSQIISTPDQKKRIGRSRFSIVDI